MKESSFLQLEYSTIGQNVRWQWSKCPVGLVKTYDGSGQNVRFKSFLVIVSNNSFLVIAGAKLKLTRTYYYFFIVCKNTSVLNHLAFCDKHLLPTLKTFRWWTADQFLFCRATHLQNVCFCELSLFDHQTVLAFYHLLLALGVYHFYIERVCTDQYS